MTEHSIRMTAHEVRALLAGTKTQKRCIVKPQPHGVALVASGNHLFDYRGDLGDYSRVVPMDKAVTLCPHGKPGDRLWVRETFYCDNAFYPDGAPDSCQWREINGKRVPIPLEEKRAGMLESMYYRADGEPEWEGAEGPTPWRPSIHMPRWASRITLEIQEVRVQPLQEISEEDAKAEGLSFVADGCARFGVEGLASSWCDCPVTAYSALWESINGHGSWSANPWVWAIKFRVGSSSPQKVPA